MVWLLLRLDLQLKVVWLLLLLYLQGVWFLLHLLLLLDLQFNVLWLLGRRLQGCQDAQWTRLSKDVIVFGDIKLNFSWFGARSVECRGQSKAAAQECKQSY